MFEKRKRLRVRSILEKQFRDIKELDQVVKVDDLVVDRSASKTVFFNRSTNERNMTRKTRSRQFHSAFQSGYCAVCHIPYSSLEDHIQSKRHLKLIGEDGNFISIKGFDSFLALDGIDALEVNDKTCDYSLYQRRSKMPRTRTSSVMYDRAKESPLSPVGSDSGHHLRSRKNINYMTPPLEEDSLTEKPEVVKEYRELRSSTRLLAKLTEQMVTDSDEVWNSGRPKRSCNKQRISADERLVVDNKSYYKVEVLPTKLRSGVGGGGEKCADTPIEEDEKSSRAIKKRNSEVIRLNNEAENFLFPKKQDSSDDENEEDRQKTKPITHEEVGANKTVKVENDESNNTCSESKIKKKRRTHAELFISENQKYYKFETPGSSSRLRYQGSYLAVGNKARNNGESAVKTESKEVVKPVDNGDNEFTLNLDNYNFSFENVPKSEDWYQAFERLDTGEEKYAYLNDENYWDSMILPYQLDFIPPLDPNECLTQYNQIKKCLLEPLSTSTSVTCSTPDPNASNSSMDAPFDDDSKISATENSSNSSAMEEIRPRRHKRKIKGAFHAVSSNGKNPRKSPRQHASTLAILSSLIHQRKKKAAARKSDLEEKRNLSTIEEEPKITARKANVKEEMDYSTITKNFEDEIAAICDDQDDQIAVEIDFGDDDDEEISFNGRFSVEDVFNLYESSKNVENNSPRKRLLHAKPGRKPGKRKKNRTGWPMNRTRRISKRCFNVKDEEMEDSAVESVAADGNESEEGCCEGINSIDDSITDADGKDSELGKLNSENNNKNDQSSLGDVNIDDTTTTNCDLNNSDRVGRNNDNNSKSDDNGADKVLTTKVNNNGDKNNIEYQPIVCVQKLEKSHIDNKSDSNTNNSRRSSSPKRTNRGQRRMPASPKSPRMLRRPRGRWYRER